MEKLELKKLAGKYEDVELNFSGTTIILNGTKFFNMSQVVECLVEDFDKKPEVVAAEKIQNKIDFDRSNKLMNATLFGQY